jgi:hypothetical protein
MKTIPQLQKLARNCEAPYNVPMKPEGPSIVSETPGKVIIFDGWVNLPPQDLEPTVALERAFTRCICIQNRQRTKVVRYCNTKVDKDATEINACVNYTIDPFKLREEREKKAEQARQKKEEAARKAYMEEINEVEQGGSLIAEEVAAD